MALGDWEFKWFGFWGGKDRPDGIYPAVETFVAPGWKPADKRRLIKYLDSAPDIITSAPDVLCLVCGANLGNGSKNHSDGEWVWPAGLSHYVEDHCVALPQEFVRHIRDNGYRPPSPDGLDWMGLPWPPDERGES